MESTSYRSIIQQEFNYRHQGNSAYSLRAFARDLDISPSQLSDVLKGKIGLSSKAALGVAKNLGMSEQDALLFKALVEVEHGRSEQIVSKAKKFLDTNDFADKFSGLTEDEFKIISDWHHFALLSAMELDQYDGTTQFLAKNLDLPIEEVEDAIKRLLKLDYIDLQNGKFITKNVMLKTSNGIPSAALKKFHKQHIQKSLRAIDEVEVELRDITSMTMAIDESKIPAAKEKIKAFRRELCQFLEGGPKNKIYNINIQLIPLSRKDDVCVH